MKWPIGVSAFVMFYGIAQCQSVGADVEERIRRLLTSNFITGFDLKHGNVGDAAAVAIDKIAEDTSFAALDTKRILGVIHNAFLRPAALANVPDRDPKTTLFLLQRLSASTTDASLKGRIAEEREFVLDQVAKAAAKNSPECLLGNFSAMENPHTNQGMQLTQVYLALSDPTRQTDSIPLRRMGDGVVNFLNTIIGDCSLSSGDAKRILEIIRGAFARPQAIVTAPNHEPKRTLMVLRSLETSTQDQSVETSIAQTRDYVLAQLSDSRKN